MNHLDKKAELIKIRDWEKKHKTSPVPVIALTAHAMKKDHLRSLDAGCSDHLTKPLRKQELLDAISRNICHLENPDHDCEDGTPYVQERKN